MERPVGRGGHCGRGPTEAPRTGRGPSGCDRRVGRLWLMAWACGDIVFSFPSQVTYTRGQKKWRRCADPRRWGDADSGPLSQGDDGEVAALRAACGCARRPISAVSSNAYETAENFQQLKSLLVVLRDTRAYSSLRLRGGHRRRAARSRRRPARATRRPSRPDQRCAPAARGGGVVRARRGGGDRRLLRGAAGHARRRRRGARRVGVCVGAREARDPAVGGDGEDLRGGGEQREGRPIEGVALLRVIRVRFKVRMKARVRVRVGLRPGFC